MNWSVFRKKFHSSWHKDMRPFVESEACDKIFAHLKKRSKEGETIMPTSHNTFKAFDVPLEEIDVVILGGNPYDGIINGAPLASGLFLDCSSIEAPAYELQNFYRGIEVEIYNGLNLHYIDTYSTKYLMKQGIFMMNCALTVEEYGTHDNLWRPFTEHVVKILDKKDVPVILIGDLAQTYAHQFIISEVFCLDDIPGSISGVWDTKNTFRKVDERLEDDGKEAKLWLNLDCPF